MASHRYPHRTPERDRRMAESRRATARAARSAQRAMLWGLARGGVGIIKSLVVAGITLLAVCVVLAALGAVLPVLLGALALIVVVVAVVFLARRHKQGEGPASPSSQDAPSGLSENEVQQSTLMRHLEILKDCEDLVNNSVNFQTVLSRYDLMLQELSYFSAYEEIGPEYLPSYGINFKTPASELWKKYSENMAQYLNAAVDRILDAEIENALSLKTKAGQEKRIAAWPNKMQSLEGVPAETLRYIQDIPVLTALREPKVSVSCPCGNEFQGRPHAYKGFVLVCPKCGQKLRANTSKP